MGDGGAGEEDQVGEHHHVNGKSQGEDALADAQQAVRVRVAAEPAVQVQPEAGGDFPVQPGEHEHHHGDHGGDADDGGEVVDVIRGQTRPPPGSFSALCGGSREGIRRLRGSSAGRPLR